MFGVNSWSWADQNGLDKNVIMIYFIWQGAAQKGT